MKYGFQVAIRNDQGQVLILEKKLPGTTPGVATCLPNGTYDNDCKLTQETVAAALLRTIQRQVIQDTGVGIGGIHLVLTKPTADAEMQCFSAYETGGKLSKFPVGDYLGASWVTPSLALTLRGLPPITTELLRRMFWIQGP
jgi:hypothetical protein